MEKVRAWYGQPSDRGRLRNRTEQSQRSQIGRLPYFNTWCGPSADLECRSEMCCTRLAGNTGHKKFPKLHHLGTITQLCRAISSQLRHILTIGETLVKQQYLPQMSHNIEGSMHKGSISRNRNFSGNEFLCFASFTSSFYQHALAIVY